MVLENTDSSCPAVDENHYFESEEGFCVVPIAVGDLTSFGNTEITGVLDITALYCWKCGGWKSNTNHHH